ncbi:nSTAND1 domain-containing NTPase [Spirosoma arboris]|nr:TIR domain-containing protein [Spirosoma arboris]
MRIFLSYNRKNQSFVTEIAHKLKSQNFETADSLFFDQDNLESGDKWAQKIQNALVNSDACVVFIGEQGIGNWQMKEVLKAIDLLEEDKTAFRIIPVIVPHSDRENVQKSFPWFLADTQWIEFTSPSDSDAFQKLVVTLRENAPAPFPIPAGTTNPYKGLESFGVDDAAFFFGRTFDVNRVFYYHLRLASTQFSKRFLAIIGNSGSGKSSFAKAGLLASLKAGRFEGSKQWLRIILTPDNNPLLKLATALEKAGIVALSTDFKNSALQDSETLRERLEVFSQKVVLLIDQFEEVITQCKDNENRTAFLANLAEAVNSNYLICIITMRSDFYSSFAPYRDFNFLLLTNNYTLAEIDANTNGDEWHRYMRDIISKPARLMGVNIEPQLVNRIIEDLREINGVLPILQLALQQLWLGKKVMDQITTSDYDRLAGGEGRGIAGVIEMHANTVFNLITSNGNDVGKVALFKAIFIRLVEITSGKDDVRKTISQNALIQELRNQFTEPEIQTMLIDLSGEESRLIRIKGDLWIDVIHEVLIRKWEKLKGWINERREAIAYKQDIEKDINDYEQKVESYIYNYLRLFNSKKLETFINWKKANPDLTDERIDSFFASIQTKQRVLIVGGLAMWVIIITGLLWYNFKYLPENSKLAKYWKEHNYKLEEIHKLKISDLDDLTGLQVFTNLDTLLIDANGENFNQARLDYLPEKLTYLSIKNAEISEPLNFSHLRTLNQFVLANIPKLQSFSSLQQLASLQTLSLSDLPNLQDLKGLNQAKSLKNLILSGLAISDLKWLEQVKSLQSLTLSGLFISNLKGLNQVHSLQALTLFNLDKLETLNGLEQASSLQILILSDIFHLQTLKGIEKNKTLKSLTLKNVYDLQDLKELEQVKSLKNLTLSNMDIKNMKVFELARPLQSLYLYDLPISDLKGLEQDKYLQILALESLANLQDLSELKQAKSLQNLTLSNLTNLQSLKGLELGKSLQILKLESLANLKDLKGLEQAKLLRNLTLSNLAGLQNLKEFELGKSLQNLTLSSLDNLQDLKWLEQLLEIKILRLNSVGNNELKNSQVLLKMPLDSLFLSDIDIRNVDFRKEKCKVKVLIYNRIGVDENWIVEMARHAPQTKFLNAKDLIKSEDL